MLGASDNIITILSNFLFYWITHYQFRQDCFNGLYNVIGGLGADMTSPELPWPKSADLNISQ
jgi:hypothetical protein